jgi:hypothetical protein
MHMKNQIKKAVDENAHDMSQSVIYHLETMYPAVWAAMSGSCRRSLINTIKSTFRVHAEEVADKISALRKAN